MSKAKFAAAKELIQEKKYNEARAILEGMEHPTAKRWLARLDKLDKPKQRQRSLVLIWSLSLLLMVVVAAFLVVVISKLPQFGLGRIPATAPILETVITAAPDQTMINMQQSVKVFCMQKNPKETCDAINSLIFSEDTSKIFDCYGQFGNDLSNFGVCIRPDYAKAYDAVLILNVGNIILSWCTLSFAPVNGIPLGRCQDMSSYLVQYNPNHAIDDCYAQFLSWNVIFDFTREEISQNVELFGWCLYHEIGATYRMFG